MFDGVPEQFHQFIASSRASVPSPLPLPLLPPLSHHSTFPPFHGFDPFPNPNPSPANPHAAATGNHQHHFLHHPPSILLHHKDVQAEEEEEEKDRSSLLAMSMNFDIDARAGDHSPWSNEEVVALLRIGSGMENWFPEATWEHVSRKLAELGFKRSAEKCKEKFEEQTRSFNNNNNININVNYSKNNNNNYRLLVNELEGLYNHNHHHHDDPAPPPPPPTLDQQQLQEVSLCNDNVDEGDGNVEKVMEEDKDEEGEEEEEEEGRGGEEVEKMGQNNMDLEIDSGAVDIDRKGVVEEEEEEEEDKVEKKRKRREKFGMFKRFCERVVERLMAQQEEMHNKLIEDMMRRDREMVEKEEAWKKMEMERVNKELDVRAQEHTISYNRQTSIIELLKRFRTSPSREGQDGDGDDSDQIPNPATRLVHKENEFGMPPATTMDDDRQNPSPPPPAIVSLNPNTSSTPRNPRPSNNTEGSDTGKRWPKEEVLALINLRCTIQGSNEGDRDQQPHGGSVKLAPLWERISQGMSELGYKRSAKRCKEKWENINKYFRKTKDSNASKKRSLDSRTCPYFHQLSTLYSQGKLPTAAPPENRPESPENHPSSQETQ